MNFVLLPTPQEWALKRWAVGAPRHGIDIGHAPDYSCCSPRLGVGTMFRDLYVEAGAEVRFLLALNFLLAAATTRLNELARRSKGLA